MLLYGRVAAIIKIDLPQIPQTESNTMPTKKNKATRSALSKALDVNGDGVVDYKDAIAAAKIASSAVAGVGATAIYSASAGSTIVAMGATALASKATTIAGAAAGLFVAATLGSTTTATFGVLKLSSTLVITSSTLTTAVSGKLAAASAAGGALLAQTANGAIAGFPIIQKIALSKAASSGSIVIVAGTPMSVAAAVSAGLVAIIIVGGYAYYVLTKDRLEEADTTVLLPTAT
jgi:hypothetical protein